MFQNKIVSILAFIFVLCFGMAWRSNGRQLMPVFLLGMLLCAGIISYLFIRQISGFLKKLSLLNAGLKHVVEAHEVAVLLQSETSDHVIKAIDEHMSMMELQRIELWNRQSKLSEQLLLAVRNSQRGLSLQNRIIADVGKGVNQQLTDIQVIFQEMEEMKKIVQQNEGTAGHQVEVLTQVGVNVLRDEDAMKELSSMIELQSAEMYKTQQHIQGVVQAMEDMTAEREMVFSFINQTVEVAQQGECIVTETQAGMTVIRKTVLQAAKTIRELGESSTKIISIIDFIDDLSNQTNLLSLNAAIEAARAGEHGRGFAVVADEVRKLAERSSIATKEIKSLVSSIREEVSQAIQSMDEGTIQVEKGSKLSEEASDALRDILTVVGQTAEQINGISSISRQAGKLSSELVSMTGKVVEIMEQGNAATEEFFASFQILVHEICQVKDMSRVQQVSSAKVSEKFDAAHLKVTKVLDIVNRTFSLAKEASDSNQKMSVVTEKVTGLVQELRQHVEGSSIQTALPVHSVGAITLSSQNLSLL